MKTPNLYSTTLAAAVLAAVFLGLLAGAQAGDRRFTYVYETTTMPKGAWELETWVTWKTRNASGGINDDSFEIRHELEYGVTDRFQLSLYLPTWTVTDDEEKNWHTRFKTVDLSAVYSMTNPSTDLLGSALYGEVKVGDRRLVLEGKLLLQKNIGPWIFGYNLIVEGVWENAHYTKQKGEIKQTAGVSYQINPNFTVGVEALQEIDIPHWNWDRRSDAPLYVGPNVSFRKGNFFVTLTALAQVSDLEGEPDAQTRMICGVDFLNGPPLFTMNNLPRLGLGAVLLGTATACQLTSYVPPVTPALVASGARAGASPSDLVAGRALYGGKCTSCHGAEPIRRYAKAEWPGIMEEMASEAKLTRQEHDQVLAYVLAVHNTPPEQ